MIETSETLGVFSRKLYQLPGLSVLTGKRPVYVPFLQGEADIYAGWGYGQSSEKARKAAVKKGKNFLYLEDGFLRSLFPSNINPVPLSITADKRAPYYDYNRVSDLETLLTDPTPLSEDEGREARAGMAIFQRERLGKYVITGDEYGLAPPRAFKEAPLLLIDQVAGDLSLTSGGVNSAVALNAIKHIRAKYPHKKIFLKTHPDVLAKKKTGCFDFCLGDATNAYGVITLDPNISLQTLLSLKPETHVLTSLAGFEALIYGCDVTCHGLPWYAGYGLTRDLHPDAEKIRKRRGGKSDLTCVFHRAYLRYPRYVNPTTGKAGDFFDVADHLALQARHIRNLSGDLYCFGFRRWKQKDMLRFIKTPYNRVIYCGSVRKAFQNGYLGNPKAKRAVWGYQVQDDLDRLAFKRQTPLLRVEDSFIRSVGLGSDFIPPLAIAADCGNLYFHPGVDPESDIRKLLRTYIPTEKRRVRARRAADFIIRHRITKYNLDDLHKEIPVVTDKKIIFVPGQVDDDASIKFGARSGVKTCTDLLKQVRADNPDSFILFKPHPEIVAGNRQNNATLKELTALSDHVETEADILTCIEKADAVACITSLSGFEALIRAKPVMTYGLPFYAGYGLTEDKTGLISESNNLALEDLIFVALIQYPLYAMYKKGVSGYVTIEEALETLRGQKESEKCGILENSNIKKLLTRLYQIKKWIFR